MLNRLFRQFSGPEGALGHVAGWTLVVTLERVGFGAPAVSRRAIGDETIAALVAGRP